MNLKLKCVECLVDRGVFECMLASDDVNLQMDVMKKFLKFFSEEISNDVTPSFIGTYRYNLTKEIAKNRDFYYNLKKRNNEIAESIAEEINKKKFNKEKEKLEFAVKCAITGNATEFGVKDYDFKKEKFKKKFFSIVKKRINVQISSVNLNLNSISAQLNTQNIQKIVDEIEKAEKILYIADNSGEIVFDKILIDNLTEKGKKVVLAVKGTPVMDDICIEDLKNLKFKCKTISCGNYIGVYLNEAPEEFMKTLKESDLVIAKGMANYETLPEELKKIKMKKKVLYLLMAKCEPIAEALKVKKYSLVARIEE